VAQDGARRCEAYVGPVRPDDAPLLVYDVVLRADGAPIANLQAANALLGRDDHPHLVGWQQATGDRWHRNADDPVRFQGEGRRRGACTDLAGRRGQVAGPPHGLFGRGWPQVVHGCEPDRTVRCKHVNPEAGAVAPAPALDAAIDDGQPRFTALAQAHNRVQSEHARRRESRRNRGI